MPLIQHKLSFMKREIWTQIHRRRAFRWVVVKNLPAIAETQEMMVQSLGFGRSWRRRDVTADTSEHTRKPIEEGGEETQEKTAGYKLQESQEQLPHSLEKEPLW